MTPHYHDYLTNDLSTRKRLTSRPILHCLR